MPGLPQLVTPLIASSADKDSFINYFCRQDGQLGEQTFGIKLAIVRKKIASSWVKSECPTRAASLIFRMEPWQRHTANNLLGTSLTSFPWQPAARRVKRRRSPGYMSVNRGPQSVSSAEEEEDGACSGVVVGWWGAQDRRSSVTLEQVSSTAAFSATWDSQLSIDKNEQLLHYLYGHVPATPPLARGHASRRSACHSPSVGEWLSYVEFSEPPPRGRSWRYSCIPVSQNLRSSFPGFFFLSSFDLYGIWWSEGVRITQDALLCGWWSHQIYCYI